MNIKELKVNDTIYEFNFNDFTISKHKVISVKNSKDDIDFEFQSVRNSKYKWKLNVDKNKVGEFAFYAWQSHETRQRIIATDKAALIYKVFADFDVMKQKIFNDIENFTKEF